jgi:hypothetical protein
MDNHSAVFKTAISPKGFLRLKFPKLKKDAEGDFGFFFNYESCLDLALSQCLVRWDQVLLLCVALFSLLLGGLLLLLVLSF